MKLDFYRHCRSALKIALSILFLNPIIPHSASAKPLDDQDLDQILVSIKMTQASVPELFREIKRQTKLNFAYSQNDLEGLDRYDFNYEKASVKAVLVEISRKANLQFKRVDNTISLKKREVEKAAILISGFIKDTSDGSPLIGATVRLKGTQIGTTTDTEGNFSFSIPETGSAVLMVSFVGYNSKELVFTPDQDQFFEIFLEVEVSDLAEVVVVGYGTRGKRALTNSISSIKSSDFANIPVTSFDQAIASKLAGVQVSETSGAPGSGLSIRIRGTSSITAGNDPLYVVDGVPISDRIGSATGTFEAYADTPINPLSTINVNDIESIDVLKDAAAAAIYGSRGANGVVLIKTKSGKPGRTKVSYSTYYGRSTVTRKLEMMDAYQYSSLKFDGHNNSYLDFLSNEGITGSVNDPNTVREANGASASVYQLPSEIIPYVNGVENLRSTDWQDAIFREASIQSHTFSASGGKDNMTYFLSGTYLDQEGIVRGSGYKQYSSRFNFNINDDKYSIGFNFSPSRSIHDRVKAEGPYWADGVIGTALVSSPLFPVFNQDGSYAYNQHNWEFSDSYVNPVALAELTQNDIFHNRFFGNVYFEIKPIDQLVLRSSIGTDINGFNREYYRPKSLPERDLDPEATLGMGRSRSENLVNWVLEQTASYTLDIGQNHHVNALLGATMQKEVQDENYLTVQGFPNDLVRTLNAGTMITNAGSKRTAWSLLSYFSRVQYDFRKKLFVSGSIRTDGSSRFGTDSKWGLFPSASMGWVASSEPFLLNSNLLSFLKLRSSYGVTGNFNIGNFEWVSDIGEQNYVLGTGNDNEVIGVAPASLGNRDLRWEKTSTFDLGLEIGLFDDKVFLEADYYKSETSDLLLNVPVPDVTGFGSGIQNIGEVINEGYEFTVSLENQFGDLHCKLGFNFATNQNQVKSLGAEDAPIIVRGGSEGTLYITRLGSPIASYYTYVRDGIFQSEDEISSYPHLEGTRPGDARILDLDEDGLITENDRAITGNYFPDYTFGVNAQISFRGFDLSTQVQGVQGNEVMNLFRRYGYNLEGHQNNFSAGVDRWVSPEQPGNGSIVRANRQQSANNRLISDWMVEDASFVRIRNITFGYTFPYQLIKNLKLTNARVFVSAQNPFTFTDFIGYNPEVNGKYQNNNALVLGEDYGTYPLAKTISVGFNLEF